MDHRNRLFGTLPLLASLSLIGAGRTFGTSVVIGLEVDRIYVAADSLWLDFDRNRRFNSCKILPLERGRAFVATGMSRGRTYDVFQVARESCSPEDSLQGCVDKFADRMARAIRQDYRADREGRQKAINYLRSKAQRSDVVFLVGAFIEVDAGQQLPAVKLAEFVQSSESAGSINLRSGGLPAKGYANIITLGNGITEINDYLKKQDLQPASAPSLDLVKHLVEIAIAAEPDAVGPPIDILELGPTTRWIQRQTSCPNIQAQ